MDSDVPDLEDFSDIISKISKPVIEIKQDEKIHAKTVLKETKEVKQSEFGGMKKGFLFTDQKKSQNKDNIPFLKANPSRSQSNLVFKEVQEENKKNTWLTDDLINFVADDKQLSGWLSNPKTSQILSDFEKNPKAAMLKYSDDKESQEMLLKFGTLLGGHFNKLNINDHTKTNANDIIIPGYEPNKPPAIKSSLDNKVDKAMATEGVKEALIDPNIQKIIDCLRSDPNTAQYLIKHADKSIHDKLRLLVESGVLGIHQ